MILIENNSKDRGTGVQHSRVGWSQPRPVMINAHTDRDTPTVISTVSCKRPNMQSGLLVGGTHRGEVSQSN